MISAAQLIEASKRHVDRHRDKPDVQTMMVEQGIEPDALAILARYVVDDQLYETEAEKKAARTGFIAGFCHGWDFVKDLS